MGRHAPTYQHPINAMVDNFGYDNFSFLHQQLKGFQQAGLHLAKGLVLECSDQNTRKEQQGRVGRRGGGRRRGRGEEGRGEVGEGRGGGGEGRGEVGEVGRGEDKSER